MPRGPVLTRTPTGIRLYFPPLRDLRGAATLALFGAACLIAGLFAAIAVAPLAHEGPGGLIALWLMSAFILPFVAFGLAFPALALYRVANSLAVEVTGREIRTVRRVFGLAVRERRIKCEAVADLLVLEESRLSRHRGGAGRYTLVATARPAADTPIGAWPRGRLASARNRRLILAEDLRGDEEVERLKSEIARSARLGAASGQ